MCQRRRFDTGCCRGNNLRRAADHTPTDDGTTEHIPAEHIPTE